MTSSKQFSSGMELAPFLTSTGLLHRTWNVISSPHENEGIVSNKGEGLSWKVYKDPYSDFTIIAFEVPTYSNLQPDLIPSSVMLKMNFHHFDFLSTKRNPIFHVDRTAFSLFYDNHHRLDAWKKSEINSSTKLIVTGHGLGGSIASLFTISLLGSIRLGKNRPLCITYGSPLIGDKTLQQAISRSRIWNSCFLHVVSLKDPLPTLFITNYGSSWAALSQTGVYIPFGTFLFCSDLNSTCYENRDSVLELLILLGKIEDQNEGFQLTDYGKIVENLNHKSICEDLTTLAEDTPLPLPESISLLKSCFRLQMRALGFTPHMQEEKQRNSRINSLVKDMERKEMFFIFKKGKYFDPFRKLNAVKINMAQLNWYKEDSKRKNIGYYDSYKNMNFSSDQDAVAFHKSLTRFWEIMVERANNNLLNGGAALGRNWLSMGTCYRIMVEPLAIAEYYRKGGKDYMTNRSQHFVLLEEWFRNETTKTVRSNIENSYFWECVEKALLSRQQSMVVNEIEDNFDILSDEENDEDISKMCPSFWARVDGLLLSSKELNVDEEDSDPCFEACVDGALLSRQGSIKDNENNINAFGAHVNKALLSRQESMVVRDRTTKINVQVILASDSCFWAHVEEALLLCHEFKVVEEKQEILKKLVEFEDYVYGLLQNYQVSLEIFLPQSSYMRWWNEYKAIKGTSYNSELASFMNDPSKGVQYSSGLRSLWFP